MTAQDISHRLVGWTQCDFLTLDDNDKAKNRIYIYTLYTLVGKSGKDT